MFYYYSTSEHALGSKELLHGVSSQRKGSNVNEGKEGANKKIEESVAKANCTL